MSPARVVQVITGKRRAPVFQYPHEAAFIDALAHRDVFVMPGRIMAAPGYFRVSLTASAAMIEQSLPVFEEVAAGGAS